VFNGRVPVCGANPFRIPPMRVWETEGTQLHVRAHKGSGQQMAGQTGAQPLSDSKVDRPSPATFHTTKRPPPSATLIARCWPASWQPAPGATRPARDGAARGCGRSRSSRAADDDNETLAAQIQRNGLEMLSCLDVPTAEKMRAWAMQIQRERREAEIAAAKVTGGRS
jgi:hypothetical protein